MQKTHVATHPMATPWKTRTFLEVSFEKHVRKMLSKEGHQDTATHWLRTEFCTSEECWYKFFHIWKLFLSCIKKQIFPGLLLNDCIHIIKLHLDAKMNQLKSSYEAG